jgi:hypothetical protein
LNLHTPSYIGRLCDLCSGCSLFTASCTSTESGCSPLSQLYHILKTATQVNRFPTSCAIIVGGATLLPRLLRAILVALAHVTGSNASFLQSLPAITRLRFICTFLSAWYAFNLLNRDSGWTRKRALSGSSRFFQPLQDSPNQHHAPPTAPPPLAGKTVDFTLFALTRAIDVVAVTIWTRTRSHSWHPENVTPRLANLARYLADPTVFAFSAAVIMWSWFYSPTRLPRAYNHWISTAAAIDSRLISILRLARQGDFIYGQDTGQAPLLQPLCEELNLPLEWADPAKTIPIPCEIVHMGVGPSCELHALHRFFRSWLFAIEMYLPLQLLLRLRYPSLSSFRSGLKGAAQSSAFLGAFVSFFYYGVCLARTRLGPKLFSRKTVTPQMWDSGLCVLAGCMACGWSILLEKRSRRQEIAFFVVPRALATLLPRVYEKRYRIREQIVFATSVAVVMVAVADRPQSVRGALGQVLGKVLST